MLQQLKELTKKKEEAYKVFREAYYKVCDEFNNKLVEILPYKDSIIRIDKAYALDISIYIKVREVLKHGDKIIIRGYGFESEFTPFMDATFVDWDGMQSFEFKSENILEEVEKIHVITEVEFNEAFDKMIMQMKQKHINIMI